MRAFNVPKNHMTFVNANLSILATMYITNTSNQQIMVGILALIVNTLSPVSSWPKKWELEHAYDVHSVMRCKKTF